MFAGSFRLVNARLIPRPGRCKQALLLATAIVAGCGGSGASKAQESWQSVRGPGYTFEAPAGWKVVHEKSRVSAAHDVQLVQVATFPLLKPYDASLFGKVARELRVRMREIAGQTNGTVAAARTVRADGVRAHAYDVSAGDHVDEYTFVLAGKREYLLLCRRAKDDDHAAPCSRLTGSFSRAS
jgi:hypothetical protein